MADGAQGPPGPPPPDSLDPEPSVKPVKVRIALPRQSQLFFLLVLGLAVALTWLVFKPFLIYMVTGVFVAVLALPIDRFWERFFPNRVAAFFTIFTLFLIMAVPLAGIGIALYQDAVDVAQEIQHGKLGQWVNSTLELVYPQQSAAERNETTQRFLDAIEEKAQDFLGALANRLVDAVVRFFVALTVILFVVYYVLTDGHRLVAYLRRAMPLPPAQLDYLLGEAHRGLQAVFRGQIVTSLIQGAVGGVGFLIAGVPGVILWSLVMAIFSLLPVLGAFMVWLPAAVWLIVKGKLWQGIFLLGWGVFAVSLVDNFVRPKLIGNLADIHPLFVLIGVLGGVAAFGFIGLFLGPVLVGVTLSVLKVWERDYLDRGDAGPGAA